MLDEIISVVPDVWPFSPGKSNLLGLTHAYVEYGRRLFFWLLTAVNLLVGVEDQPSPVDPILRGAFDASAPTEAIDRAAGFDLYAAGIEIDSHNKHSLIDTSLNGSLDPTLMMLGFGRTGLASNHGIGPAKGLGVIGAGGFGSTEQFKACRMEWPEAPAECYIGADPLLEELALEPASVGQPVPDVAPAANDALPTDRLWTSEDCAVFFRISRWTFVNRLSKKPGFPKPHIETSRRMRRWLPEDIQDYRTKRR